MNSHITSFIEHFPDNPLVLIQGNKPVLRNGDVHYPFRQDSDFLYLTGLSAPGLALTIREVSKDNPAISIIQSTKKAFEIILWREPVIEKDIIWGSDKLPDDEMLKISGIEDIRDIVGLEEYCREHVMELSDPEQQKGIPYIEWLSSQTRKEKPTETKPSWQSILTGMRTVKTPDEIAKIQKCIRITESIYQEILEKIQPGMYEYEIEAMIAYGFRRHHGTEAFSTIVASGVNSCTLHYTQNTRQIESGDIVLIDFGIELGGYGADISRTFAVGGLSPRQQEIYDAVADVKSFAENTLKPDITRKAWNLGVKQYMYEACKKLNLPNIENYTPTTNPYYRHSIGHFLGLDTHDVGGPDTPLVPGMVVTIEPGIYMRDESIGIRIEDDYLVTDIGCVKL